MGISLKTEHLKRYKDIAMLFMKYGRSDLVKQAGLEEAVGAEGGAATEAAVPEAEELADDLERLGPTFIKLGQLLSTRADLLPPPYLAALARLQDNIEPFTFAEAEKIISSELQVRLSKAFADFDRVPVAAASLGQVYRATLRDGRQVVVKVQRPEIREQIAGDLDALNDMACFLDSHTELGKRYEFENMLSLLRKSLMRELDYRQEAGNLITFRHNLRAFERIVVPAPVEDYTTSRVLTMEFIQGKKITTLSPLTFIEIDGASLADELFSAYLQQMLVDGFFHADPHPGNIFLTDDARIAILDLGMVARIMPGFQENMLRLLLAISEGRGEEAAEVSIKMGEAKPDFDRDTFTRRISDLVALHRDASLNKIDAGQVVLEITRISAETWFRLPPEFTMIAKTLLNLDQVVYTLEPSFDPNAVIRRRATEILQQRVVQSLAPGNILSNLIEIKEFLEKLPVRVNKILDAVGENKLKFSVDAIDEKVLLEGFQKIANRITLGLLLAALIVGAALLMRVETSFRIFGYPGLAMIFFLIAAAGGLWLALTILYYDERPKKKGEE
ncbi:MAG: AarF/UbiB family protein [Pyrinomonadaceae bacterium]